jgi:predicted Ser/Thr protein kinase
MEKLFNNKKLNFLGKGAGGGEVRTNGTYAYKFLKSNDREVLERELKFTQKAADVGVAPPIYESEIKRDILNGEFVLRIKMKKLFGNLLDYAKTVSGGKWALFEVRDDLLSKLHKQGRICHNDISNPDNIMHDGKRLYIIDYSEATYKKNNFNCDKDANMINTIMADKKWARIPVPSQNNSPSPKKTQVIRQAVKSPAYKMLLNSSPMATSPRSQSGSPMSTPKRFRAPSGSPRSPNGTPRSPIGSPMSTPKRFRAPSGSPRSPNGTPRSPSGTPKRRRSPNKGTPPPKRSLF